MMFLIYVEKASAQAVGAVPFGFFKHKADPCSAENPAIGVKCKGGTIWLGELPTSISHAGNNGGKTRYMIMPGGCDGTTSNPICSGQDSYFKNSLTWNDGTSNYFDFPMLENITGNSPSTVLGDYNTAILAAATVPTSNGNYKAAKYCADMTFGSYDDWYLPSKSELAYIYCKANVSHAAGYPEEDPDCLKYGGVQKLLPGFPTGNQQYQSSTEVNSHYRWTHDFAGPQYSGVMGSYKDWSILVRCIRRF